jgi:hypothetical protein
LAQPVGREILAQPFRPIPIRGLNTLGRVLARVGRVPISLDDEELMSVARKETGLSDFGPSSFRPGLTKLMQSIEVDGRLNLFGRYFAKRQMVELLSHRL